MKIKCVEGEFVLKHELYHYGSIDIDINYKQIKKKLYNCIIQTIKNCSPSMTQNIVLFFNQANCFNLWIQQKMNTYHL